MTACRLIGRFCAEPSHWPKGLHRHAIAGVPCHPGECPATGGDHVPTDDVGPEHERLPRDLRWHCDECGKTLPAPQREEP